MGEEKRWGFGALGKKTKIIVIVWILFNFIILAIYYKEPEFVGRELVRSLVMTAGGYLFGCFCQITARERAGNTNLAFLAGFFFGIFAGLYYWIIYSHFNEVVEDGES